MLAISSGSLNVAMVDASCRCHGTGVQTTDESFRLIETA